MPDDEHPSDVTPELRELMLEYEAQLLATTDPEEQWRIRRILWQLRANIIRLEKP